MLSGCSLVLPAYRHTRRYACNAYDTSRPYSVLSSLERPGAQVRLRLPLSELKCTQLHFLQRIDYRLMHPSA
jgi:hypothetical protein